MTPSDSLHLDEHLAKLLAAFDQGLGNGDGRATIDVPLLPPDIGSNERLVEPLSGNAVNLGSLSDLMPDSRGLDPFAPLSVVLPETHRIGRFELRRQLGKGGCGIVFLAYDPKLKREVALKIPRPELLMNTDARRRLLREATAAAGFDHPNLVPVYETGEIGPVCFIATVFCPGLTLSDWLDKQSYPVPIRQAARLVAQLAEAIQHAHDRGVLHRDIKPNNVILQEVKTDPHSQEPPPGSSPLRSDYYIPRVVDFGLAKLADQGPGETGTRQVLGTPKYMAPEQAQARHDDVGPEADVYALGVILYEMLVGRPPYEGATDVEVLRLSIEGNLTAPRSLRKEIPRDLEAICLKAMARSPVRRYRTAIDLADDLRRFLDGRPTLARPLNSAGRAGRWLRRNDQAFALIVLSFICVLLLAIGMLNAHQNRKNLVNQNENQVREADRFRQDNQRNYSRHVRDAFLSWRSGDLRLMNESLQEARLSAGMNAEAPDLTWGYLSGLGKTNRTSIACPAGKASALAVSPLGEWIATGHADGTVSLWKFEGQTPLASVRAHRADVSHLVFLDEKRLVSAGAQEPPRIWSIAPTGTLTLETTLPPLDAPITAIGGNRDHLVLGTSRGLCVLWNIAQKGIEMTWQAAVGEPVHSLVIAPNGSSIAGAGRSGRIRLWNKASGTSPKDFECGPLRSMAFVRAEGDYRVMTAGDDGLIRVYDRALAHPRILGQQLSPISALTANTEGSLVASAGEDGAISICQTTTGRKQLLRGHDQAVHGLAFAADGRTLISTGEDGLLKSWDAPAESEGVVLRNLPSAVIGLAVRPDGPEHAAAFGDGSVEVLASPGAAPRRFEPQGRKSLAALRFPVDGPPLGVELDGQTATLWEFGATPRIAFRTAIAGSEADFHLSANHLVVGDTRGQVSIWSLTDRELKGVIPTGLETPVRYLALSDNGRWLSAATLDNAIGVWAIGDATVRYKVPAPPEGAAFVGFIGTERLAIAGRGSSVRIWHLANGKVENTLLGHAEKITSLAVSPDLRTLASGTASGELKLWDVRTGFELASFRRHNGAVRAAEFSNDSRSLLTGGADAMGRGELAYWEAAKDQ